MRSRPVRILHFAQMLLISAGLATVLLAGPAAAFNDDFEDGNFSDWIVQCGGWRIVADHGGHVIEATQLDNILIHSTLSAGFGHYHCEVYFPGDRVADAGLIFQIVGSTGYWVLLGPDNSDNEQDRIIRLSNGGVGPGQVGIGCASLHLANATWHPIDVYRFPSGVIQVFMDNEVTPRMEAFDSSVLAGGKLALRAVVQGVRFDNVSFDPVLTTDPPAPAAASCPSWGGLGPECALNADPPPQAPPAPTGVSAQEDRCRVIVSWQDVAGESGYRVYRDGLLVGSVAADQVQYSDQIRPGNYTYCVSSFGDAESEHVCAAGSSGPPPAFFGANGNYYEPVNAPVSWSVAKVYAESYSFLSKPGHLATIHSSGENTFVAQLGGPNRWLGGYQADTSNEPYGGWAWVTGEPFSFTSWATNEPNNNEVGGERENYLEIKDAGGGWNDVVNGDPNVGFVVEYETATPLAAPANVTASDNSIASVQITWSPAVGVSGYQVLRDGTVISDLPSSASSYNDAGAAGTFTYCVRAVNACGCNSAQACDPGTRLTPPPSGGGACGDDRRHKGPAPFVMFAARRFGARGGAVTFGAEEQGGWGAVTVFDISGRSRQVLWSGEVVPGKPVTVDWDGRDGSGSHLPTGIYFMRFTLGSRSASRTILLAAH